MRASEPPPLPKGWRSSTLGDIAREKPNNGVFRKNSEYSESTTDGLPVVWVKDLFGGNSIDATNSPRLKATNAEVANYGLRTGDILFCRSSLKLDGIAYSNVWMGREKAALFECHIIRISPDLSLVDPLFLNHQLRLPQSRAIAKSKSKTSTMTTIDQQGITSIPIVLPPIPEQRRIADILDRAEALRAQRRAAIAQLDELTQAIFVDMFGDPVHNDKKWSVEKLAMVGTLERGVSKYRPRNAPELLGGAYPLVQTGEVANCDGYIRKFTNTYSEIGLRQSKLWPAGTLCITIAANIAKTGILTFDACFPDSVVGFCADEPATVEYIRVWLSFLQKTLEDSAPESAQKNINLAILRNLDVPLPPLSNRRDFARRIDAVDNLKSALRTSLTELDALFATLQHRAFRGEL